LESVKNGGVLCDTKWPDGKGLGPPSMRVSSTPCPIVLAELRSRLPYLEWSPPW
jgi:hypothetical protein